MILAHIFMIFLLIHALLLVPENGDGVDFLCIASATHGDENAGMLQMDTARTYEHKQVELNQEPVIIS